MAGREKRSIFIDHNWKKNAGVQRDASTWFLLTILCVKDVNVHLVGLLAQGKLWGMRRIQAQRVLGGQPIPFHGTVPQAGELGGCTRKPSPPSSMHAFPPGTVQGLSR